MTLMAFAALTAAANAVSINPTSGILNSTRWQGNQTSVPNINDALETIVPGITASLAYKQSVGGAKEGSLANQYATVFSNSPSDPAEATITYTGGTSLAPTAYLLVKDGNQKPAWYFYNATGLGWNGTDTLELSGFWPNRGAISFVALYGGKPPRVPDGGSSILMLGSVLLGSVSLKQCLGRKRRSPRSVS